MHEKPDKGNIGVRSYTSLYDIFGSNPFQNILYRKPKKKDLAQVTVYHAVCGDTDKKLEARRAREQSLHFITSEMYNNVHKSASLERLQRSTSTIFYDLDDIARKQSLHYFLDLRNSSQAQKCKLKTKYVNGFHGKSDIIVQECATQLHPKMARDSAEIHSRRIKRQFPNDIVPSSEIFLRDNDYDEPHSHSKRYYDRDIMSQQQKFWSYAKYRAEYRDPIPEEKKSKKKERDRERERGKRTENPCPCQLFSYACPCTDQKSLSELAKNSKSVTVTEQTSTTKLEVKSKSRRHKHEAISKDNKLVCTSFETRSPLPKVEHVVQAVTHDTNMKQLSDSKCTNKTKGNNGKSRLVICPHCKEKVEIKSSTEESSPYNQHISTTATVYTSCEKNDMPSNKTGSISTQDDDYCTHDPPCELIPLCQIVPEPYLNVKMKKSPPKPRVIRITKACRHHPPCTVVPSCQRANVLKNNCEFISPCLHRPRCVNLPLCVPISKTFNLEDLASNQMESMDSSEYPPHQCKYVPIYPDSLETSLVPGHFNLVPQIQNTCEFVNKYNYQLSPPHTAVCPASILSSYRVVSQAECSICKLTKSCQYELTDPKAGTLKESVSDAVIFIRDVGCQFRNRTYSPTDSVIHSKTSSASFEYVNDRKMGNFFTAVHTLRYEDKFTAPSKMSLGSVTTSISTTDVDSQCPSHGHRAMSDKTARATGFTPTNTTQYVAYSTFNDFVVVNKKFKRGKSNPAFQTHPLHGMRSLSISTYKKLHSTRRRKRTRGSSLALNPKKSTYEPST